MIAWHQENVDNLILSRKYRSDISQNGFFYFRKPYNSLYLKLYEPTL